MEIGRDCIGIGCGALIFDRENRLLLIKRSDKAKVRPDEWSVPGGKVGFGEQAEDAIVRETEEEIGIKIKINKFIGYADEIDGVWHWLLLYFLADQNYEGQPVILEPKKHVNIGWFKIADLPPNISYYHVVLPLRILGLLPIVNKEIEHPETIVIGAIGYIGAGKDAALDVIANEFNFRKVSIGDIARDIARKRGWSSSRENLHQISVEFFEKFGKDYFSRKTIEEIEESCLKRVVVSGVRTSTDVKTFKDYFGKRFILIFVDSSRETRFQRLMARSEERDSKKIEDLLEQESEEDLRFGISEAILHADYTIKNEGDMAHLKEVIVDFMSKLDL